MNDNLKESNLERFQNFVYSDDLDIVCANETWLSENVYNAPKFCILDIVLSEKIVKREAEVFCWELKLPYLSTLT